MVDQSEARLEPSNSKPVTGGDDAPEVDITREAPIPVITPGMDNPQWQNDGQEKGNAYYAPEDKAALYDSSSSRRKSSKRPWIISAAVASLIGLGTGIGIGYAAGHSKTPTSASASASPTTITTTMTSSGSTSTATSSAITSGTTGIAAYDCNATVSTSEYTSDSTPAHQVFTQECHTDYPGSYAQWNSSSIKINDLQSLTVYSFQSCMDQCAMYNSQQAQSAANGGVDACQAVTYDANLTSAIQQFSGNCWLKNARGAKYNGDVDRNYSLVASAYIMADS